MEKRVSGTVDISEETVVENFLDSKDSNLQIQEAHRSPAGYFKRNLQLSTLHRKCRKK